MSASKNTLLLSALLFCVLFLFPAPVSDAQIAGIGEAVILKANPILPGPNETVTLTAESFLIDMNRANVTWRVNGRVVKEGRGIKQIEIQSGALGERSEVAVSVSGDIGSGSASLTIIPTEVNVLWEAQTYTPPFYRGKALPSPDSEITFIALSDFTTSSGRRLSGRELLYTWKNDKKIAQQSSGYGRDVFSVLGPTIFRTKRIDVEVSSLSGEYQGKSTVLLSASNPQLLVYEKTPLLGVVFEHAVEGDIPLAEAEITLTAYPLYFPIERRDDQRLVFEWRVDGERTAEQDETITLRRKTGSVGKTSVNVLTKLSGNLFQQAQKRFSIILGGVPNTIGF